MTRTLPLVGLLLLTSAAAAADPADVPEFLKAYCTDCHGAVKPKGKVRLDHLTTPARATKDELTVWASAYEQLSTGQMPPADSPRPKADHLERVKDALRGDLTRAGVAVVGAKAMEYPGKGNLVDHALLFGKPSTAAAATPARVWRLSPYAYREFADDLTAGKLIVQGGPAVRAKQIPLAPSPFGLTGDPGFRDYAFRYQVSSSETQQLATNARVILGGMLAKRAKFTPPKELVAVASATGKPTADQLGAAVRHLFNAVLYRDPTPDERTRYVKFVAEAVDEFGNREGLISGLVPVFLHPEAVFRSELGAGKPDAHGRLMLAPTELAVAIAYALTDHRPDDKLLTAARTGKLATRDDARREVKRLLDDPATEKDRILRFFQEYFDYDRAPDVFKDPADVQAAGIGGRYEADLLVTDTDRLVKHVLAADKDVLRELLTTDRSFVGIQLANKKGGKDRPPFGTKPGQGELYKHYSIPLADWSETMPLTLPKDQRAGVLTQPAWLIAHSANTENHAIHRGKWVRERLLGGSVPDTPITVEAKLPEEPANTLRHRMRVTREAYCYKCHQHMDPLGLPFEMFDHLGQFRATELGKPVDTSGEIVSSGDAKLDGKVTGALALVRKLADSERVRQVFVRHAFRYWMGRNETADDAKTLQDADRAYTDGKGSMNALVLSLLTSDSFLYRRPDPQPK